MFRMFYFKYMKYWIYKSFRLRNLMNQSCFFKIFLRGNFEIEQYHEI